MRTTLSLLFFCALVSTAVATPLTPVQSRYDRIQLVQRASSNSTSTSPSAGASTVTIKSGDSLASISAATGVGICDIAKANSIKDPNVIIAGQTLTIPAATGKRDDTSCLTKR